MINLPTPSVNFSALNTASLNSYLTNVPKVSFSTGSSPKVVNDSVVSIKPSFSHIESLVQESQHWFDNAFRASNDQLYDLLTKCYGYYHEMDKTDDVAKSLRNGLKAFIEEKQYRFNGSTHTLNKIVKCVFGFDRRRVSAYGIVLKAALLNKVPVEGLTQYITEAGGIEEIRVASAPNAVSSSQKAEQVATAVEKVSLGTVIHEELSQQFDNGKIGQNTLLVGTWQADGSIVIRAVIDNESALTSALATQYVKHRPALDVKTAQAQIQAEGVSLNEAVNQAAEMLKLAA